MALSTVSRVLAGFKLGFKEPHWSEKAISTTGDDGVTIKGDGFQYFLQGKLSANANNDKETIVHELRENDRTPTAELPETELPDSLMSQETAYRLLKQQLNKDNDPRFNLATFVSTYMEPEAEKLIVENLAKNFVDPRAYPRTADLERRCLSILANLYHLPIRNGERVVGTSTLGSSEAIMLAILAMKARWLEQQQVTEKDSCAKPNIIVSSVVQVCWEKAARYFDVEIQTGEYEDVKAVNDLLIEKGLDVPIHVDAASGGFVAPFVTPELEWDFRLEKVRFYNINLKKNHQEAVMKLGTKQASFTLNFSRGSSHVIAQYYQFVRLGKAGYVKAIQNIMQVAINLAHTLREMGFLILSKAGDCGIPVVAFRINPSDGYGFDEFDLAGELGKTNWLVPAYHMADGARDIKLLRVVCRVDFTPDLCDGFVKDLKLAMNKLKLRDLDVENKCRTCLA